MKKKGRILWQRRGKEEKGENRWREGMIEGSWEEEDGGKEGCQVWMETRKEG